MDKDQKKCRKVPSTPSLPLLKLDSLHYSHTGCVRKKFKKFQFLIAKKVNKA